MRRRQTYYYYYTPLFDIRHALAYEKDIICHCHEAIPWRYYAMPLLSTLAAPRSDIITYDAFSPKRYICPDIIDTPRYYRHAASFSYISRRHTAAFTAAGYARFFSFLADDMLPYSRRYFHFHVFISPSPHISQSLLRFSVADMIRGREESSLRYWYDIFCAKDIRRYASSYTIYCQPFSLRLYASHEMRGEDMMAEEGAAHDIFARYYAAIYASFAGFLLFAAFISRYEPPPHYLCAGFLSYAFLLLFSPRGA